MPVDDNLSHGPLQIWTMKRAYKSKKFISLHYTMCTRSCTRTRSWATAFFLSMNSLIAFNYQAAFYQEEGKCFYSLAYSCCCKFIIKKEQMKFMFV